MNRCALFVSLLLLVLAPWSLRAQDTRTVTEPSLPLTTTPPSITCSASLKTGCVCAVLTAQQSASSLNQTVFDTAQIQNAMGNVSPYSCSNGQAVELAAGGSNCGSSGTGLCNAFLTQPLSLKNGITLLIDAGVTLFGSLNPVDYGSSCGTISASGGGCALSLFSATSTNEAIMGYGTIDGQGGQYMVNADGSYFTCDSRMASPCTWWQNAFEAIILNESQNNPIMLDLHSGATNFVLYKITLQNSPMFHVTNTGTSGFTAWDVKIVAPYYSSNTDGIDPGPNTSSGSSNITITNSYISTGDDEIAIKGNHAISNITISHNHLFNGHGMSIGSETEGGVSNVLVNDLVMNGVGSTDRNGNGLRIKSAQSEGGTVNNVNYQNVCIQNEYNPLIIDPFYVSGSGTEYPNFKSVALQNVHIYNAFGQAIMLEGYNATYPLNLSLDNVQIDGYSCKEFTNEVKYANITLGPDPVNFSSCLTGTGVTVTNNISDSNPAYTCPASAFVPLAAELFTSAKTFPAGQGLTLNVILQAMIPTYAPPAGGTISLLEGSNVVGSAAVASNNALAYLLTPISIGTPSSGQHTYTAEYTGDPSANYAAGITFGSLTITVEPLTPTTTTVTSSPANPVYGGGAVNVTAAVAPTSGSGAPTGTVTFTVDGVAGAPISLAGGSAVDTLSSLTATSHTISAAYSGDSSFSSSSGAVTFTVNQATPALALICTEIPYDGNSHSCTGSATGLSGAVNGSWSFSPASETAAGSYPVTGTFTSTDSNYLSGGTATCTLIIDPVTPTLTVTCPTVAYDGNPHSCTGSATGLSGAVNGSWSFSPASETAAGSYPVTGTFTSTDPNYLSGGTAAGTLVIGAVTPTVAVTCPTVAYDGNAHSCTGSATGLSGAVNGSWSFSPASETAAGSYPVTGTFTSTDPNYLSGGTATGTLIIGAVTPTVAVTCPTVAYDGNAHSCTGSAMGLSGAVNGSWSFSPASETAAGSYAVTGTFTSADPNYLSGGTAGGTLIIGAVTPTVAVTCPTVAYDGNAHSCTATVTGVGGAVVNGATAFSPGSETAAGSYPETATFTSGNSNYTNGSGSGTLVITAPVGTPALTLNATSVTFPNPIMIGQSAPAQYVLITSTGSASLQVSGVTIGGTNPGDFLVTNQAGTCTTGATLVYHAECNLRVVFAPTAVGARSAILFINDNVSGSPQQVLVSGTAISGAVLSLSAGTLTFPATTVGSTAATQYLTLKSTGYQAVVISQVVLSSGDFDLSDQAGTCTTATTTSLVPGANCNIRVKFHPTAKGARSATVVINDNTASSPHTVTLNGTGQ